MLTIKGMLKGVRKRVEITPKRGPARFRKQRIEEAVAAQLPEVAGITGAQADDCPEGA